MLRTPESAAENGVEGTVYIMFQVEPDGSLSNINIMRGVDPVLDNEAVQVVKSAPNWEFQNRKAEQVNPRFRVAIEFKKE